MPTPPPRSTPRPSSSAPNDELAWETLTVRPNSPAASYMYPPYSPPPTIYRPTYPVAQPYPPYPAPQNFPAPAFSSGPQQTHHPQPYFSSFANITPVPSPPGYELSMSERDDDDRSGQGSEDWRGVEDKTERRKMQNRNAQRKHRERLRHEEEERRRIAEQAHAAGSAYTAPDPDELEGQDPSGLPWGSVPLRQVFQAGRAASQQQSQQQSQQTSREGSSAAGRGTQGWPPTPIPYAASGLGLRLSDRWARGQPAWAALRRTYAPYTVPPRPSEWPGAPPGRGRPNG